MIHRFKIIAIIWFFGMNAFSQNHQLSGSIIDEKTGQPLSDVHVLLANGRAVITDSLGYFSIGVNKMPVILRITHVSYGQSDVKIQKWPEGLLVIRIQKMISNLEEVLISGERMRILTKDKDFSLQDFAFDDHHLWMLGYTNNQANKGRLFLANQSGDTVSSIPIQGAKGLYKDAFGQVHLVLRDSVIQLFCKDSTSIQLLYSAGKKNFMAHMEPIITGFSNKLVYRNVIQRNEEAFIYYYDEKCRGPQFLTHIVDSLEAIRKEFDQKTRSMWIELKTKKYFMPNTKISGIYNSPVRTPIFSLNDSLYVVNSFKDSLLIYDHKGKFAGSVSISFHKDLMLGDVDYKEIKFLTDNNFGKVYILERKTAGWSIHPLDTKTGKKQSAIPLPNFPGMTRITVHNNAVYFLYYEKMHPYFTRLYRFQL